MKAYLCVAVVVLMLITSMGIFGFLSKAHSDQGMVSGDVQAKIAIYDEKIKTERENIDANRKALKQMDEAVDQVMGRSADEKGADKAVAIRRAQQKERARLLADIAEAQKKITVLNEERAPIAAEVRKVEAEVGPIKYIAALIYGDNPDANLLERAVRWVIILLVTVFDPLAVMMLLAATESRKWIREKPKYESDDGSLTDEQIDQIKQTVKQSDNPSWILQPDPSPPGWMYNTTTTTYPSTEEEVEELKNEFDRSKHAYLDKPFVHFENLKPMPAPSAVDHDDPVEDPDATIKEAMRRWKEDHPNKTLKEQRRLFEAGKIDHLPWEDYMLTPEEIDRDIPFGNAWPKQAVKGDMFIRTDDQPTRLFKFNGLKWIEVDKLLSDRYAYNEAYIDYLITQISSGNYDTDLLSDSERLQLESRLKQDPN
jgi:Skp family chaperone for outer membrane proteins